MRTRILITFFCTLIATWQYILIGLVPCVPDCLTRFQAIADGTRAAPFAYRIFVPYVLDWVGITLNSVAIYHMLMFGVFFILLWIWAQRWHVNPIVVLLTITLILITMFPTWFSSFYTILEWNLWLTALLLLPSWRASRR